MNSLTDLSPKQLRQAADIQEQIQGLQQQLTEILGTPAEAEAGPAVAPAKRKILL